MPPRRPSFAYISPTHITPIACSHCGENARLLWHSPLPAGLMGEMRTFQCKGCGKQTKIIVEDQIAMRGQL